MQGVAGSVGDPLIVVLGGYGALGGAVVGELLRSTGARVAIAGRSEQRARRVALALGERTRGIYADASDPRTLDDALAGASLAICCASGLPRAAAERAVALRLPLVDATPMRLERGARLALGERAWEAGVPIVLHAGAVPGLAGVAAEFLARRDGAIERLHIASSGPWRGTHGARADLAELERARKAEPPLRSRWRGSLHELFPAPIGRLRVKPSRPLELEGWEGTPLRDLSYVEAERGVTRWLRPASVGTGFALRAVARSRDGGESELLLTAPDPLSVAAVLAAALARAVLRGEVAAGLSAAHEACNPGRLLAELRAAGLSVSLRESGPQ